jgi:hypothetical protein
MIEPLYRRNDDLTKNGVAVNSLYRYKAILQFLYDIEILAPEVTEDLKGIMPIFKQANKDYINKSGGRFILVNFMLLKKKGSDDFRKLCDMMEQWAKKYNLLDDEGFYISIALNALKKNFIKSYIPEKNNKNDFQSKKMYKVEIPKEIEAKRKDNNYISLSEGVMFAANGSYNIELYESLGIKPFSRKIDGYSIDWEEFIFSDFKVERFFPFIFIPVKLPAKIMLAMKEIPRWSTKDKKEKKPRNLYEHWEQFDNEEFNDKDVEEIFEEMSGEDLGIAWDPRKETWEEFEKKVDKLYEYHKEAYRKEVEEFFKDNGYVEGKKKKKFDEHIKWLVLYQVKGWELGQVAKYIVDETGKSYDESNIYKNVKDVAELVGLTLRDGYR